MSAPEDPDGLAHISRSPPGGQEPAGHSAAVDAAGLMVAPPLAGFTFALIVLVLQEPSSFRFPDLTLLLLTASGLLFVATTQFALRAKRLTAPPGVRTRATPEEVERADAARELTRLAHNLALALFFAGVAVALVPNGDIGTLRWIAVALAGLACLGEIGWVIDLIRTAKSVTTALRTALAKG